MEFQLVSFVQVAKDMNFSKAADKLFISQSTMSARIKKLETILGAPLFHRLGKDIRLSEFGEIYLPYAEQCLKILAQGKRLIDEKKYSSTRLRIGVTNPFSSYVFPYILPEIYYRFPDINIQVISVTHSEHIIQMIKESQIDIGFINNIEPLDQMVTDNMNYSTLYESPLILVSNPLHPLCQYSHISIASALSEHKFIYLSSKTAIYKLVDKYFEKNAIKPLSSIEINSVTAAKEIIKMIPILTLLPKLVVNKEIENGVLTQLILNPTPPSLITSLVYSKDYEVKGIVNFIKEKICESRNQNLSLSTSICC